jgi:hypothetical protein
MLAQAVGCAIEENSQIWEVQSFILDSMSVLSLKEEIVIQ